MTLFVHALTVQNQYNQGFEHCIILRYWFNSLKMAAIWDVAKKAIKEALIHVYTPVGDEVLHPKERQRLPYPIRPRRQIKMDTPAPPTNTATMPRISDELRDLVYNWWFTTRDGVAYFLPPVTIEGSLTIITVIL